MKPVYLGIIVIGALLIYEAVKGLKANTPSNSQIQQLNATVPASQATGASIQGSTLSNDQISGLLQAFNLPSQLVSIVQRESNGQTTATCFAPGSRADLCTPQQKPGDTQGAFGLFQFLNSTWNGLGCGHIQGLPQCQAAPNDPLGVNYSAYDPTCAAACAQRSVQQSGLSAWGLP